jgi:Transposase DDE domain group 1
MRSKRTDRPGFTREGDEAFEATRVAPHPGEAALELVAAEEIAELARDEARQAGAVGAGGGLRRQPDRPASPVGVGRLAGYENDADRLGRDPAMRWIVGGRAVTEHAASTSQMGRLRDGRDDVGDEPDSVGRPLWALDRPCSSPARTNSVGAGHRQQREPDVRRAGRHRLQRPLRLHLLPPAVRGQSGRRANAVRLQLHALAHNLANFLRTLALPGAIAQWSLTTLREKVVKIGAKVVTHGRYLVFQMAEVAVPRELFRGLLDRIAALRPLAVARC